MGTLLGRQKHGAVRTLAQLVPREAVRLQRGSRDSPSPSPDTFDQIFYFLSGSVSHLLGT